MTRIKNKGHYRKIERDEKGKFVKVEKWSSKIEKGLEEEKETNAET